METLSGHAFISYVREDSHDVDILQQMLVAAGIPVWRDTGDLWPGQDWRMMIRRAITKNALAFIACFSSRSIARSQSYQNEELALAIEQLRQRKPDVPWLIPVRFDDCDIPDLDLGGGRTLASIQRVDLFGKSRDPGIARLMVTVLRILGLPAGSAQSITGEGPNDSALKSPKTLSGRNSKVLEINLDHGNYRMSWTTKGQGYFGVAPESGSGGGGHLVSAVAPDTDSGEVIARITESGRQIFSIEANGLDWTLDFVPL